MKYRVYDIVWERDGNLNWDSDKDVDEFNEECRKKLVPEVEVELDEDTLESLKESEQKLASGEISRKDFFETGASLLKDLIEDKFQWIVESFSYRMA